MKRLVAFVILLAAAGGGIWYYYKYGKPVEKPQVVTGRISRGDIIETVTATGALEPLRRVDVGSQVSGVVQDIFVDYNTIVKKGQVLAQIDPTLLQVQVDIRTAAIERQTMDIANQEIQLEDVRKQLERTKNLFEKGLQNQQQLEAAELSVKLRQAQIDSAKKQLVQAQADLQQAKLNVQYTTITSPIDGVVVERRVDRGQTVQSSMTTPQFFILATDLRTLKLTAGVDEADIGKIRPGMDVDFNVEAYGQTRFRGTVDSVRLNAQTANNVVTYPVWITVENPDLRLRPSMTASVKIVISTATDVTRVPNNAFRFRPNNDMYLALGLTPPAAGQGRRLGGPGDANGDPQGGPSQPRQGGQGASAQGATPGQGGKQPEVTGGQGGKQLEAGGQPGQGGQGRGNRDRMQGGGQPGGQPGQQGNRQPGSGGFGRQSGMGNLTPEQLQAMRERFAQGGGRGQGGQGAQSGQGGRGQGGGQGGQFQGGGRGGTQGQGGRGGRNQEPVNTGAAPTPLNAEKIDELFKELPKQITPTQVWTWDEAKKELKQINIRVGVSDGTFSELVSGDVQVGQEIVTNIIIPQSRATTTGQNPFMQQPGRGGPGGGFPGGGPGGPGGGGGGRGGGGGGGRGGN